jgi:alanine dehydrogenase
MSKIMIVGIVKEQKSGEKRVAITPTLANELAKSGCKVIVEQNAGIGSDFSDSDYLNAGCEIFVENVAIWENADIIIKVKEPQPSEFPLMRKGLILFSFLHPAGEQALTSALINSNITAIAFELVRNSYGNLPILAPMSEIAGKLAVVKGGNYLLESRGIFLGGGLGTPRSRSVIIGGGVAGEAAARELLCSGSVVTIFERNSDRIQQLKNLLGINLDIIYPSQTIIDKFIENADLVIGAVHIPGANAPKLVTRNALKRMKAGGVFVDIAIDQGGCSETSIVTSLAKPTYIDEGILHYCVPNMPALTPYIASVALSTAVSSFIREINNYNLPNNRDVNIPVSLRDAVVVANGRCTNTEVAKSLNIAFSPFS